MPRCVTKERSLITPGQVSTMYISSEVSPVAMRPRISESSTPFMALASIRSFADDAIRTLSVLQR
jgi:hypothetical protein